MMKFSDFILGFILGLLALAVGRHAMADSIDTYVNANIKEEYIRMELQKQATRLDLSRSTSPISNRNPEGLPSQPVGKTNDLIDHQDDISPLEQSEYAGSLDRPQVGLSQKLDPNDAIENKIVEDQAYDLYREHYRGAAQKEFNRRARAAGIDPTRATAAIPYVPTAGTQRN
jgi:hypothetical protein